jgi:hypothetical protein
LDDDLGLGAQFPHPLGSAKAAMETPLADELVELLAKRIIDQWQLGKKSSKLTDVLTVSFSGVDLVGHRYGPDSIEMLDALVRVDRCLARLMQYVKEAVGDDVIWALTSDHGATRIPELNIAEGRRAGRVVLNKKLLPLPQFVKAVHPPYIYVDDRAIRSAGRKKPNVVNEMKKGMLKIDGVEFIYAPSDLETAPDAVKKSVFAPRGNEPRRGGDLYVTLRPNFIFSKKEAVGTSHGQPSVDDQHVPLAFLGPRITAKTYNHRVSVGAMAPTLLSRFRVSAPELLAPLPIFVDSY